MFDCKVKVRIWVEEGKMWDKCREIDDSIAFEKEPTNPKTTLKSVKYKLKKKGKKESHGPALWCLVVGANSE